MLKKEEPLRQPEFILVVIMLLVLTVLVVTILWMPIKITGAATEVECTAFLDYRKSILAVILTAFGAWVGAGAAYFFGRENLREATSSMLRMREPSARERLRLTPVREMPLKLLDWRVKLGDKVENIMKKLKDEVERWFIPIVNDDDTLKTVMHEEAFWRFVNDGIAITPYAEIMQKTVSDVLAFLDIGQNKELKKRVEDIYVCVTLDKSAGDANELMQNKNVYLAVVLDKEGKGKPTHFITTADVRKVLLQTD